MLTGFFRYHQLYLNKPDAWVLFAAGMLYIKYVESVIAFLSKDRSQQNFILRTSSDCSLTQTAGNLLWQMGDCIWLSGEGLFSFSLTCCLFSCLSRYWLLRGDSRTNSWCTKDVISYVFRKKHGWTFALWSSQKAGCMGGKSKHSSLAINTKPKRNRSISSLS